MGGGCVVLWGCVCGVCGGLGVVGVCLFGGGVCVCVVGVCGGCVCVCVLCVCVVCVWCVCVLQTTSQRECSDAGPWGGREGQARLQSLTGDPHCDPLSQSITHCVSPSGSLDLSLSLSLSVSLCLSLFIFL